MRVCCLFSGARSVTRSPISPCLTTVKFLRKSETRAKGSYINLVHISQRSFHETSQPASLKSTWRETFLGVSGSGDEEENSYHNKYLQTHEGELAQLKRDAPTLYSILEEGHTERVLHALLNPMSDILFRHASPSFFAATFSLLDPKYFVDHYKEIYYHIRPTLITGPNEIRIVRSLERQFGSLSLQLEEILVKRSNAGHALDLVACKHILAFAATLGDKQMADLVWKEMMPSMQITPDVDCYAYYMEAYCWAGSWTKHEYHNFRLTDWHISQREKGGVRGFENYSMGPNKGLKSQMIRLFNEMASAGLQGNEAIFTNLIVAMGREGDLEGVKSILKSVWNIDVDLLQTVDEEELETPSQYEADSPLRPSSRLLFTLAHVFGNNNKMYLALALVDFVSRQYNLHIPQEVWFRMLEFMYVHTVRQDHQRHKTGLSKGSLPAEAFENLWVTCTDEPHNVKPDIAMKIFRSTRLRDRYQFAQAVRIFEACKDDLFDIRESLYASIDDLLAVSLHVRQQSPEFDSPTFSDGNPILSSNTFSSTAGPTGTSISSDPTKQGHSYTQEIDGHAEDANATANNAEDLVSHDMDEYFVKDPRISNTSSDFILPARWLDARRKFLTYSLCFERDLQNLIVFARRMLRMGKTCPRAARRAFSRRYFPRLLEQFEEFLPETLRFALVKHNTKPEEDMQYFVELRLKKTRMEALLRRWTSVRWGENLQGELFTTTNARLRNLCQIDSHDGLMTVCQMLTKELLHQTAWTRQNQPTSKPEQQEKFLRSFEGASLDLDEMEPAYRDHSVRRASGEKWRSFASGSTSQDPTHIPPSPPNHSWVDPTTHIQEASQYSGDYAERDGVEEDLRWNDSGTVAQALALRTQDAFDRISTLSHSYGELLESRARFFWTEEDNDPTAPNPEASPNTGRHRSKSKPRQSLHADDARFLEEAMSRAPSQAKEPRPSLTNLPSLTREDNDPTATDSGASSSPRRRPSFPEQLSEMESSFFHASDEQDGPNDNSHDQQTPNEQGSSKNDNS